MEIEYEKTTMHQCVNGVEEDTEVYIPKFAKEFEKEMKEFNKAINSLGKYGRLRYDYLRNEKYPIFIKMFCDKTLLDDLRQTDIEAKKIMQETIKSMAEADGCNEELKARDQMKWVGLMNNYRNCADEIILDTLVYV